MGAWLEHDKHDMASHSDVLGGSSRVPANASRTPKIRWLRRVTSTQFLAFICDVRSTKWRLTDFCRIVLIALPRVATKERNKFHSQALVDGESKQLKDWTQRINSKTTLFYELWKEKLLSISVTTSHGNGQICQNFPGNPQVRREALVALYLDWLQRPLEVVLLLQGKKVWRCQFGLSVLLQVRLVQRFVITHGQRNRLKWTMLRRKGSRIY